jgi:1-deoxyxylulose-5-phosphate synthase
MKFEPMSRREFLGRSALAAGAVVLAAGGAPVLGQATTESAPAVGAAGKRTAVDQVMLGSTGLMLSRLGIGTGSNNGETQLAAGVEAFNKMVHYAFDQGITYIDTAPTYRTFGLIKGAIKGLPREKLFILSKLEDGQRGDIVKEIDRHRTTFGVDYVDCMLVHCQFKKGWTGDWKKAMDGILEAQDKKWIKARGVSCHSLPALRAAVASDWNQVHLVRVNPQGVRVDSERENSWENGSPKFEIAPVLAELKNMKEKKRGIIGMKIMGNGEFKADEDREKSVRFAMARPELDAVVIGVKNTDEIDKAIKMINAALAAA